jgi:hypothetical protein
MKQSRVIKVVVAYEDFDTGTRAMEMSERLAFRLKPRFEINSSAWKFEMLAHPQLRNQAVTETSEADMIIVSAHDSTEVPAYVKNWMEGWLTQKRGDQSALVALLDQAEHIVDEVSPLRAYLRQMAERGCIDFFCKVANWRRQDFEYRVETVDLRAESNLALLHEILHLRPAWWDCGINE